VKQNESKPSSDACDAGDVKTHEMLKGSDDDTAEKSSAAHDEEVKEDNVSAASATDAVKMSRSAEKKARKQKVNFCGLSLKCCNAVSWV